MHLKESADHSTQRYRTKGDIGCIAGDNELMWTIITFIETERKRSATRYEQTRSVAKASQP